MPWHFGKTALNLIESSLGLAATIFGHSGFKRPTLSFRSMSDGVSIITYHKVFPSKVRTSLIKPVRCFNNDPNERNFDLIVLFGGVEKDKLKIIDHSYLSNVEKSDQIQLELYGQDAVLLLPENRFTVLGVADGVGGYQDMGIDSGKFALALMKNCLDSALNQIKENKIVSSQDILQNGFDNLLKYHNDIYGGSTVSLVSFDHNSGRLEVCSLGDSRIMIIKPSENSFMITKEQEHNHNCPYQLSNIPEKLIRKKIDIPKDAENFFVNLKHGDVIVAGTDGFFDNIMKNDILKLTHQFNVNTKSPSILFSELFESARHFALFGKRDPILLNETFSENLRFKNGKIDDLSLIIAIVVKRQCSNKNISKDLHI